MSDMTKGKPILVILWFAIPLIIGNIFQQFYSLADTMIVGNCLGEDALAAVGATNAISGLIIGFINGLTNGFAIIIARYFGAKNEEQMKKSIGGTVTLSFLITVLMMIISGLFMRLLLQILHTPEGIINQSWLYIMIIVGGMLFTTFYNAQASILRAIGNTIMPLVFLVIAAVLNVALDLLFVKFLDMGVAGAAIATIIAQAVSGICCFVYIRKCCKEITISKSDLKVTKELRKELMDQGLAMGFMSSFVSIGTVILQSSINGFGEYIIAAHTTARRVFEVTNMPVYVIAMASATFSSQNFGAGRFDRVKKGLLAACIVDFIWDGLMIIIMFLFAPQLIHGISGSSMDTVISMGSMYVKIAVCFYPILGVLLVMRNGMQGIGYTTPPIVSSGIELAGKVLAVWLLTPRFGYYGVMVTEPIIWVICGFTLVFFFIKGLKKYEAICNEKYGQKVVATEGTE